ncbi:hypothetical protein PoB_007427900 [Plakobranchus ocellatus]|uniref:Uncharacterized protein n=1 Tax=Plakobranchus ocellatus TaxID=259542 RepID=A0AAV4DUT6_9GAST|nr:hypothetical protein PoB_007427900 [Plakobranchus ocellatus]
MSLREAQTRAKRNWGILGADSFTTVLETLHIMGILRPHNMGFGSGTAVSKLAVQSTRGFVLVRTQHEQPDFLNESQKS